ncbi:response regulator transcription factor [Pelomonas sp. P7]|uniref:Response regulator transcription factor n=2 Tax=Roseateles TaxID=93681 RepID=A0ABS8XGS5_9BURK|nr:response regulator transcription factor [Pelomonas sp. P7]MCE4538943.1 response regulator transcription factor [Pelomonas sp. P7]
MIRLLLADDHAAVREGLRQLFAYAPDMLLEGEFASGEEVIRRLSTDSSRVDLLLLDLCMPGVSGVELLQRLCQQFPWLPVLVLTMHNEASIAQRAMEAGAAGFLSKDSDPEDLLDAVRRVAATGRLPLAAQGGRA